MHQFDSLPQVTRIDPIQLLRDLSIGHLPELRGQQFYNAGELATELICEILPRHNVDVEVEGSSEYFDSDPLLLLYDYVSALQRNESDHNGITDNADTLGLAQLAIQKFVNQVLPHCKYRFHVRPSRQRFVRLLPARATWGKHIVKNTKPASLPEPYTPFKDIPK